jgi:glucosamine--fructose-6-phosphate aminotransferase (isomerizing)
MCGIVGIVGHEPVTGNLISALRRLEYRGYDSAGIATVTGGRLDRRRAEGALSNLESVVEVAPIDGRVGIGHTRWATHGRPIERNAHPHSNGRVSVVHNGIIENCQELRAELTAAGAEFDSDTDTEVVVHLVDRFLRGGTTPSEAVRLSLGRLRGTFALALIFAEHDDLLIAARRGSPLAIGLGQSGYFIGSDAIALAPLTDRIIYLEDGDWAIVLPDDLIVHDRLGNRVARPVTRVSIGSDVADKGNHRHFMAKEIAEQPDVVARVLSHYLDLSTLRVKSEAFGLDLARFDRVCMSACGTAYYAAHVGKYWIERLARMPVDLDVASEFRYREMPVSAGTLALFVSQSGETADTLAALRYCRGQGLRIASVVNVATSSIARESDVALPILAGPEIGVASTKAFTCQLAVLAAFALALGKAHGRIDRERERELVRTLLALPGQMADLLQTDGTAARLGEMLAGARDVLYVGRGVHYPMALEGALKLKEISYLHAEGYAAGELKHGPIALVDASVPVVVLAPKDELFEKTISNLQEVAARGGRIIAITDACPEEIGCELAGHIALPSGDPLASPILAAVPLQLLAYHTAMALGRDVDKPRNLAKSVTVE